MRFAVAAMAEGLLSREEALLTIDAAGLDALVHPSFALRLQFSRLTAGVAASPAAAKGQIVFSVEYEVNLGFSKKWSAPSPVPSRHADVAAQPDYAGGAAALPSGRAGLLDRAPRSGKAPGCS